MSGAAGGAVSTVPFRTAFARLFLLRTAGTVSLRFAYPFLPTIADGLGTSLGTLGIGVACGEVAGLAAPAVGRRLDRIGRRQGMVDGLVVSSIGCAGIFLAPNVVVFGVALFLVAIGRHFFDVSFGAWIGDEVPFERRGRVSGVGELAWSGAFLVGVPIAGLLAAATSWRVPYLASAALLLASIPVVRAPSANTLALLCRRESRASSESWQSAARTPGTRLAAILMPIPLPHTATPRSARPAATASAKAFP